VGFSATPGSKTPEPIAMKRGVPNYTSGTLRTSKYGSEGRKGHSTESALLEILDGVYTAADNKEVTVLIGIDLSAAFDSRPRDSPRAPADRVRSGRNAADLAPVLP